MAAVMYLFAAFLFTVSLCFHISSGFDMLTVTFAFGAIVGNLGAAFNAAALGKSRTFVPKVEVEKTSPKTKSINGLPGN